MVMKTVVGELAYLSMIHKVHLRYPHPDRAEKLDRLAVLVRLSREKEENQLKWPVCLSQISHANSTIWSVEKFSFSIDLFSSYPTFQGTQGSK